MIDLRERFWVSVLVSQFAMPAAGRKALRICHVEQGDAPAVPTGARDPHSQGVGLTHFISQSSIGEMAIFQQ